MSETKETGEITSHGYLSGDKLYQIRARQALPLLVRQANAEQLIHYSELATELDMANPRNLNYVLGTIGNALQNLSKKWAVHIPPIQCLVINKNTGIPGEGIGWFVDDAEKFKRSSRKQKKQIIDRMLADVYRFDRWDDVLRHFTLERIRHKPSLLPSLKKMKGSHGGSGESEDHLRLKKYVADHPEIFGLEQNSVTVEKEYEFPSADTIDVMFQQDQLWTGIEVKSAKSGTEDIIRGLFQCIKYRALIEATQIMNNRRPNARVVLLLEGDFPKELLGLKHCLAVEIMDGVSPQ